MNQIQTIIDSLWIQAQLVFEQAKAFSFLYAEFIACLLVGSFISLFIGVMLNRSSAKKQMNSVTEAWETRYKALEINAQIDTENLEEQLQSLASEAKALHAQNKRLSETISKGNANIQRTRAESIELSRQHAETQERLQRIIQQKDREIAALSALKTQQKSIEPQARPTAKASTFSDQSSTHSEAESDVLFADTVVINSADTTALDSFDKTVQMSAGELHQQRPKSRKLVADLDEYDDLMEDTANLENVVIDDFVESTVVMDEEALAFARQSRSVSNSGTNK